MTNSWASRVVLGYDDTSAAAAALAFAAQGCRLRDVALVVIHQARGTELPDYRCSARAEAEQLRWAAAEAGLREVPLRAIEVGEPAIAAEVPLGEWVLEQLPEPRCDVTWSSTGGANRTLLDAADGDGLLVIGDHEPDGRHWHRSVGRARVAQTLAPVVVVPIQASQRGARLTIAQTRSTS